MSAMEAAAFGGLRDESREALSILTNSIKLVKEYMRHFDPSHDWQHILRVVVLARRIFQEEPAGHRWDEQTVVLAALLHDVGDAKYARPGEPTVEQSLDMIGVPRKLAEKLQVMISNVSYSNEVKNPQSLARALDQHPELAAVQDADRLDAIGAIGLARTFAYGAARQPGRGLEGSMAHLEDKLLSLGAMMKTHTGQKIAEERTQRMLMFRLWWRDEYKIGSC